MKNQSQGPTDSDPCFLRVESFLQWSQADAINVKVKADEIYMQKHSKTLMDACTIASMVGGGASGDGTGAGIKVMDSAAVEANSTEVSCSLLSHYLPHSVARCGSRQVSPKESAESIGS